MFNCPSCGQPFASLEGVSMHYVNTEDDSHQRIDKKWRVKQEAEQQKQQAAEEAPEPDTPGTPAPGASTATEAATDGSGSYSLPSFPADSESDSETDSETDSPELPDTEMCCSSPDHTGGPGDLFRLDDGSTIRLDEGEQICANCDEVITR